jgi:hypothetical protein
LRFSTFSRTQPYTLFGENRLTQQIDLLSGVFSYPFLPKNAWGLIGPIFLFSGEDLIDEFSTDFFLCVLGFFFGLRFDSFAD